MQFRQEGRDDDVLTALGVGEGDSVRVAGTSIIQESPGSHCYEP